MITPGSGYAPLTKGHKITEGEHGFCRYTIYDNRTDWPIIVDGTAEECANALGWTRASFYCMVHRVRTGKNKRYTVLQRFVDEDDNEES